MSVALLPCIGLKKAQSSAGILRADLLRHRITSPFCRGVPRESFALTHALFYDWGGVSINKALR
jgi:hypothetical protein